MDEHFRVATPEEIARFEQTVYPLQDRVLAVAAKFDETFVLTGGTALARVYLHHRLSDDLDLFTDRGPLAIPDLARALVRELEDAGIRLVRFERSLPGFARFYVTSPELLDPLRVDVALDNIRVEPPASTSLGIRAHTVRDIAANKLVAYEDRAEAKDLIDLYYLTRQVSWLQIFADADRKRVPIEYEHLQQILSQPTVGTALLTKPVGIPELDAFVHTLKAQLELDVQKKTAEWSEKVPSIVADLLWDAPPEQRVLDARAFPVLRRRLPQLALPRRRALSAAIDSAIKDLVASGAELRERIRVENGGHNILEPGETWREFAHKEHKY